MSNKIIILTVIYFSSLIPQGISLPQGCPCGRRQSDDTGFTQYVLARPWSEYRVDNPSSYISFPLAISRGTRAIKSRLESSEEPKKSDELLRRNPVSLDDREDIKPKVVIPSRLRTKTKNDKINTGGGDKKSSAIEEKEVREVDDIDDEDDDDDDEDATIDEDQERIDGLNLLGQLFHVLALQYQKVFGRGNNLKALETNSTGVKFDGEEDEDDDGIFELGDYDYDLEPNGQIERPEVEDDGESTKKEKRKTEEKSNKDKVINKNLLRKANVTSTTKPSSD